MLFVICFSALICWGILSALIPQLRHQLLDQPNARSSHRHPTPRGGGLAFVAVSSVSSGLSVLSSDAFDITSLPLLAAPLSVVGLLDDRHNLPSSLRYGAHLLTAVLILGFSPLIKGFLLAVAGGNWHLLVVIAFLVIAFTAVINFINFMDGLDGLVGGCIAVAIAALSLSLNAPWSLWTLVGSLLGFLFWNWSPAKVFMGDVGSTFLGAVFAGLVLQASTWPEAFGYLLVSTPLLGDACLCVCRRLLAGQRVFQAHRLHLFQRLHQAGWPHARVSLTYTAATAVLAVAMLAGDWPLVFVLAVVELLAGVWLDQHVAVPFAVASQN